jgi:hypothetical protein
MEDPTMRDGLGGVSTAPDHHEDLVVIGVELKSPAAG